jgi:hypothetical protein
MGDIVAFGGKANSRDESADSLYTLSYASTETAPLGTAGLLGLLNQARAFNVEHDITGLLLHREDSFLQVIEGRKSDVLDLYERIKRDPRHQRVEILFEEPIEEREYSDWQMAFIDLDGVDVSLLPGFSNFFAETGTPRTMLEEISRSRRLMLLFRSLA